MPVAHLLLSLLASLCFQSCSPLASQAGSSHGLDVCLHAQVSPTEKVVGSVVTTDGIRAALSARPDINSVQIFYPFHYTDFVDTRCDLVLIEGWFPSVHNFIALARALTPRSVVLFYCLDPSYPGMDRVRALDVDGFLTNSRALLPALQHTRPTIYVPLAADTELMRPVPTIAREYGAVYVGAGSKMLTVKPLLAEMLRRSVPHRLRLHGAHWSEDPSLGEAYRGVLPRGTLHEAYASAHAVLACTISSQRDMGMINNRVFEALACGSVVVTDHSDILNETFGEVLQFVHRPDDVDEVLARVTDSRHAEHFERVRARGRELVLAGHTWAHRVVDMLAHFAALRSSPNSALRGTERSKEMIAQNPRHVAPPLPVHRPVEEADHSATSSTSSSSSSSSVPLMAWVLSEHLAGHADYLLGVRPALPLFLREQYLVHEYSAAQWLLLLQQASSAPAVARAGGAEEEGASAAAAAALAQLSRYSLVLCVMSYLDPLHRGLISFHQWHRDAHRDEAITVHGHSSAEVLDRVLQKQGALLLGVQEDHSRRVLRAFTSSSSGAGLRDNRGVYLSELFDLVLFRDQFELSLVSSLELSSYEGELSRLCHRDRSGAEGHLLMSHSPFQNRTCDFPAALRIANELKWQVCFGVWEWESTDGSPLKAEEGQSNSSAASSRRRVAVCLWTQRWLCTAARRARSIAEHVGYTLLLLGGESLAAWTRSCGEEGQGGARGWCALEGVPLSRVLHAPEGQVAGVLHALEQASELFFLYDDNSPGPRWDDGASEVHEGGGGGVSAGAGMDTVQDVVWPLLYGAMLHKTMRLSEQPGAHVADLIAQGGWQGLPVLQLWRRALSVVLTCGTFKTSARFVANYHNPAAVTAGEIRSAGHSSSSSADEEPAAETLEKLMVFVHFQNFVPGLDGQACFFHDDVFCYCRYSRETYLLELDLLHLAWSPAELQRAQDYRGASHVPKSTTLRVELRGFLYLQFFLAVEDTFTFCLPNPFFDSSSADSSGEQLCVNGTQNLNFDVNLQKQYSRTPYQQGFKQS